MFESDNVILNWAKSSFKSGKRTPSEDKSIELEVSFESKELENTEFSLSSLEFNDSLFFSLLNGPLELELP